MPTPPPLPPSWDGFHPLVVHFPIALLLIAPLFVLLGAVTGLRAFMVSALLLMVIGVVSAFVATSTGWEAYNVIDPDEAMELIDPDYEYDDAANAHGNAAQQVTYVYTGITVAYAIWVILAFAQPKMTAVLPRAISGVLFVGALLYAGLLLSDAGHKGGELVHEYGVRAVLSEEVEEE